STGGKCDKDLGAIGLRSSEIGWIIGPIAGIAAGEEPQSVPWFTLAGCAIHAPREFAGTRS
ncbi:MAG: hypothetical protein ABSE80_13990, partial [Halobacteriota archaeon]